MGALYICIKPWYLGKKHERMPEMSGNRFDKLHYLVVLAEEQNMTRAAERLYVSQPALTAYINRLESSLGVRLFDRSVTPVRLTAAGRHYISKMQEIEYQQNVMLESLKRMDYAPERSLKIAIGRNRGGIWLPHIMPEIYKRFPDAHIQIVEDRDEGMAEKVVHDAMDVAIIESFFYVGSLSYLQLPDELHCLVTGYDNPLLTPDMNTAGNGPLTPLDVPVSFINNQQFICPSVRGALNYYTQQLFTNFRINPKEITFIMNNITAYQLAVKGIGTTYLNVNYANVVRTDEKPLFIMPGGRPDVRKIYAVYKEKNMTDLKRFFIDYTYQVMKSVLNQEERLI